MSEPKWLSREDVEFLHECAIETGGGSHGLRDPGLLESALGRPQNQYAYGEQDVFQLAAGYAEGIARNHPFVDGNKRTAFQSAHQFLKDNGYQLEKSEGTLHADMMVSLGTGEISREDMGKYLADHAQVLRERNSADMANTELETMFEADAADTKTAEKSRDITDDW